MTRKKSNTQAFIGPLRQGVPRPVVRLGKQNGPTKRRNQALRALRPGSVMTQAAVAYATELTTREPRFISRSARGTRIVHEELVGTVTGTASFTQSNVFAINPGIAASFPWLSTQAQSWQFYKFHRLRLCYYTRAITTDRGSVLMCADYNAAESAPSTEAIASSYLGAKEESPWVKTFHMDLDIKGMLEPGDRKYVRTGPLSSNLDIKTYDGGNIFLFTVDGSAVSWGKLWLEYDVEFFVPQLGPTGSNAVLGQHITGVTPTSTDMLGTQTSVYSDGIATVSGEVVTFLKAGKFLCSYMANCTTSLTNTTNPAVGSGNSFITTYIGNISAPGTANGGNTTSQFVQVCYINAVVGGTLTYNHTIVAGLTAEYTISSLPATFS